MHRAEVPSRRAAPPSRNPWRMLRDPGFRRVAGRPASRSSALASRAPRSAICHRSATDMLAIAAAHSCPQSLPPEDPLLGRGRPLCRAAIQRSFEQNRRRGAAARRVAEPEGERSGSERVPHAACRRAADVGVWGHSVTRQRRAFRRKRL
eukprot:365767-Chlamydomonas_euryale.AAC.8